MFCVLCVFWRGFALFCSDFSVLVLFLRKQQNLCVWRGFALFYSDFSVLVLFHENNKIWVFGVVLPFSFSENQNLGVLAWFSVLVVFTGKKKKTAFGCFGVVLPFFRKQQNLGVLAWICVLVVFSPKKLNKIWVFWRGFAFCFSRKQQNFGVLAWFCLFFWPKTTKFGSVGVVLRLVVFFFAQEKKTNLGLFWRGFAFWLSFFSQRKKNEIWVFWRGFCLFFYREQQNLGVLAWFCVLVVFFHRKKKKTKFGCFGVVLPFFITENNKIWVFWRGFAFVALILVFWLFCFFTEKKQNYDFWGHWSSFTQSRPHRPTHPTQSRPNPDPIPTQSRPNPDQLFEGTAFFRLCSLFLEKKKNVLFGVFIRKMNFRDLFWSFSPLQPFFGKKKKMSFLVFFQKNDFLGPFLVFLFFFLKNDFLGPVLVFFASAAFFWKKIVLLVFL